MLLRRLLPPPLGHSRAGWLALGGLVLGGLVAASPGGEPSHEAGARAAGPGTEQPANFPHMVYAPATNQPDAATFELGRQLFYDARLSSTGTISCGSCHQQSRAFTDGRALAVGVASRRSPRNAPTLQNLRWRRGFMADGGVLGLELQALAPLTSPVEMNTPLAEALAKLNADAEYRRRFAAIYGPGPIDTPQFLRALAQFTAALTSAGSRYDHYVRHEAGGTLTASELRGRALFQGAHHLPAGRCRPLQGAQPAQCGPHGALHARWAPGHAARRAGPLRPRCGALAHPRPAAAPAQRPAGHSAFEPAAGRAAGFSEHPDGH